MNTFFKGFRVVITGASSGIGAEVAKALAGQGAKVLITGRSEDRLKRVQLACGAHCTAISGDLLDPATHLAISQYVKDHWGGIDLAILNAGTNAYVEIDTFSAEPFYFLMQQNFFSMVESMVTCLPFLKATKGRLVMVSSLAAYAGLPKASAYGASKAAIRNMAQSLAIDLKPFEVQVQVVCPGFVKTPLTDLNTFDMPFLISAETAARYILSGIKSGKHEIHFPYRFSLIMKVLGSLPSRWQTRWLSLLTRKSGI